MSNFTFLTKEQCSGAEKLDILKKRGIDAAITDFSILLGGYASIFYSKDYLDGRKGFYWTKSNKGYKIFEISDGDLICDEEPIRRNTGARPALPFSSISSIPTNGKSGKRASDGIVEVEYGYYPQKATPKDMQEKLERAYKSGRMSRTRNSYTTDSTNYKNHNQPFQPQTHQEYVYNGKSYVRVEANSNYNGDYFILSNGERYRDGDYVWVEVSPVKWLVDEKSHIMITEKIIFAGVQFNNERNYHTRDFDKTNIKQFMDKYFSKELGQIRKEKIEETESGGPRKSRLQKLNPDKTKPEDRAKMTDTEIIHNWIEAGESVLLRGPSGIGKTESIAKCVGWLIDDDYTTGEIISINGGWHM